MSVVEIAPQVRPILENLGGKDPGELIARLLTSELRRRLEECEREMLDLEIKYGLEYPQFKERVVRGEFGDEFSYPLERDIMHWEDLLAEKRHWLSQLRAAEGLA